MVRTLYFLVFVFVFYSFTKPVTGQPARKWKILFVGNSLTYVNDLPALIDQIADLDSTTINYSSFLYPDYSLEDHWNEGKVKAQIEKEDYDFVIAQQGPSALQESQVLLMDYAGKFAELCNKNKSKLVLYMVWPSASRLFDLDNVIYSYTNAARKTSALLCPAGLAWKNAWAGDSTLALYAFDNFHPSMTGSLLAALTIYGVLAEKKDFKFLKYDNWPWKNTMSEKTLTVLSQAALKAINK